MFCPKCGTRLTENAVFCHKCGFRIGDIYAPPAPQPQTPPTAQHVKNAMKTLSDPLFLAIAIILSVAAGVGLLFSGVSIVLILIIIGVWLAYAGTVKDDAKLLGNGLNLTSIAVKIQYILTFVSAGFVLLFGIICLAVFVSLGDTIREVISQVYDQITDPEFLSEFGISYDNNTIVLFEKVLEFMAQNSANAIGIFIFLTSLIYSILSILINILFTGRFSKFLSNAYGAFKKGETVVLNDRHCASWILAYGIISAIRVVTLFMSTGNLFLLISNGCLAASCILAFALMKKDAE